MKLVKTSLFSAGTTIVRIASGFVAGKVVAIFTGPAGVALIGAFNNFIAIVLTFANGAINTGVIKYTAEYGDDETKLKQLFSTALKISVVCSIAIGGILIFLGAYISAWLFTSHQYADPVRVLGFTIVLYSLNSLVIAILNGKGQIRIYSIVNATGSIVSLLLTALLSYYYHIEGALYALVLGQSIIFFITMFIVAKSTWFRPAYFRQAFDKVTALKLSHYSMMAIVTALTVPVSQIVLRNILINELGIDAAGSWQGMMRISDGYLMIITTSLSTYYLPKLSSLKSDGEIRKEIFSGYKIILPVVLLGCLAIYLLRFIIIQLLYTPAFLPMESMFFWQLLGDFFKMAAWLLAYVMLARSMTKVYIFTEIFFSVTYVAIGYVLVNMFQLKGAAIAFSINYFIYFIIMILIFRKLIFRKIAHA